MQLGVWQWVIAALAAFGMGMSKTGVAGLGILVVAVFALILPTRASVGILLPILICGDLVAVAAFRRHAVWSHLLRLFPWAAAGVVLGYLALGHVNDKQIAKMVGAILVVMVLIQFARRRRTASVPETAVSEPLWFIAGMGVLAGFTTMVANAAGPVMILYLLAMRLPKLAFVGTGAWFFFALNLFKLPFSAHLGLLPPSALLFDLRLFPFVIAGGLSGRALLKHINQTLFENIALVLTLAAGVKLLWP